MSASHDHHHHPTPTDFSTAFAVGIGLNLAFVAIEAFYGWKINSLALLADAGHNLSDVVGLVLAWGGALAGRLRPDARHTYGWKRASILAAFVNAFLHMAADALVSAGVVVAGGLAMWFGWNWLDPVVSLAIAAVIVLGTWGLFRQSLHLLFDGVPDSVDLPAVQALLEALPGVARVHDLHVWAMGASEIGLTAHLVMPDGRADDAFLAHATHELNAHFGIGHVTLQVVQVPFTRPCAP